MCGIFGLVPKANSKKLSKEYSEILNDLYCLSETRGKESAGLALKDVTNKTISVLKSDISASEFIKGFEFNQLVNNSLKKESGVSILAHSRLVTNGTQKNNNNNQPVIKENVVLVHNGIITNVDDLWDQHKDLERFFELDTEVFAALLRKYIVEGKNLVDAIKSVFSDIEGAASVACMFSDSNQFVLATNTGSLYYTFYKGGFLFASEAFILKQLNKKHNNSEGIKWVKPFTGIVIDTDNLSLIEFNFNEEKDIPFISSQKNIEIKNLSGGSLKNEPWRPLEINLGEHKKNEALLFYSEAKLLNLKRCSKALFPETFPYISFDDYGVSNYSKNYKKVFKENRKEELSKILDQYRSKDGSPDCIVPFSGGRDSSYGLHYLVKELGMNPITFTYDWGMVTDLARRNIARMCGQLGVENILVSANIKRKRENIRKNIEAWLRRPKLGMIPLFMAGDKHFFTIVNDIKKQTGIKADIWLENKLENTHFKTGFAGIRPEFDKERIDKLSAFNKLKMPLYYAQNFATNPSYINQSIWDTITSYKAYYFEPREVYLLMFDYILWDEREINNVLLNEYNWERSPDTNSTWRIGDGTASFYNYIYNTVVGFTENDTFRSNQILEGMITREEGLNKIIEENRPRYQSIKWYLDTVGLDFERTIKRVNQMEREMQ